WDAARLLRDADRILVKLSGLRLGIEARLLAIDATLAIGPDGFDGTRSWFALASARETQLPIDAWHADEHCLAARLRSAKVHALLELIAPEVAVFAPSELTLRVLRDTLIPAAGAVGGFAPGLEIRIDWPVGTESWRLPGVTATVNGGL